MLKKLKQAANRRRSSSETIIVAGNGDLHGNSTLALCPPVVKREQGEYRPHPTLRRYLWNNWLEYWEYVAGLKKKHKARVIAVFNGEIGEINYHRSTQAITTNKAEIKNLAVSLVEPSFGIADDYYVTRGTNAHDGKGGWLAEWIAEDIEAVKDPIYDTWSWWWLPLMAEGVLFDICHHPSTAARRPWTRGGAVNRESAMSMHQTANAVYRGDRAWKPQYRWRSHVHYFADSGLTHPVRTVFSPPWQVPNDFGHRLGADGETEPVGGLIWTCRNGQSQFEPRRYFLRRREPCQA